jgi:hypothetical protein
MDGRVGGRTGGRAGGRVDRWGRQGGRVRVRAPVGRVGGRWMRGGVGERMGET